MPVLASARITADAGISVPFLVCAFRSVSQLIAALVASVAVVVVAVAAAGSVVYPKGPFV